MSQFADFYQLIAKSPLSYWLNAMPAQLSEWEHISLHGKFTQWFNAVDKLPTLTPRVRISAARRKRGQPSTVTHRPAGGYRKSLLYQLMPWRKGPFSLHGVTIDAKWRTDWKWERVVPHIAALVGRLILGVGCGAIIICGGWWALARSWL